MAPTAPDAILCGDPARALVIAQEVIAEPRMSNHHRGLWGYWGTTPEGRELTVHATGIGGPSAVATLEELATLGIRRAVRVGTCSAPAGGPPLGVGVVATRLRGRDGLSAELAREGALPKLDSELTAWLTASGMAPVDLVSFDRRPSGAEADCSPSRTEAEGCVRDLQSAALAAAAAARDVGFAAALVVAEAGGVRLEDDPLERAALALAREAAAALAAVPVAASTSTRA